MTLEDIRFALEMNYVQKKDIDYIISFCKKNGINSQEIDKELVKLGYDKAFEDSDDDEFDDEDDDEFGYVEKFPNRSKFYED